MLTIDKHKTISSLGASKLCNYALETGWPAKDTKADHFSSWSSHHGFELDYKIGLYVIFVKYRHELFYMWNE